MSKHHTVAILRSFLRPAKRGRRLLFLRTDTDRAEHVVQTLCSKLARREQAYTCVTAEDFCNDWLGCCIKNVFSAFSAKYEQAEYLIITKLDFCAQREGTQQQLCLLLQKRISAAAPTLLIGAEAPTHEKKYSPLLVNLIHNNGRSYL